MNTQHMDKVTGSDSTGVMNVKLARPPMSEQIYRRIEMPPEPWTHEDNPDWIWIESSYMNGPDFMLVPVDEPLFRIDHDKAREIGDHEPSVFLKENLEAYEGWEVLVRVNGADK